MSTLNKHIIEYDLYEYGMDDDFFNDFTLIRSGFKTPRDASEFAESIGIGHNKFVVIKRELSLRPVTIICGKQISKSIYKAVQEY